MKILKPVENRDVGDLSEVFKKSKISLRDIIPITESDTMMNSVEIRTLIIEVTDKIISDLK
jgi:hypothetical protein